MTDPSSLYNSRIPKTYIEYLGKTYPDLNIDSVLEYAGMTRYEVEDQAHWFSQKQVDRFQEAVVEKTGNSDIAREAGRYTSSHEGMGPAKQYALGLMSPTTVYLLMGKVYPIVSRGSTIKARKLGADRIEIIATPNPGVNEKLYQCENRVGAFESLNKLFTESFANVEHPECFHKGDKHCRYIITWEKTPALTWKRLRNIFFIISIVASLGLFLVLSLMTWSVFTLLCIFVTIGLSFFAERLDKIELTKTIESQGDAAKDLLEEMSIRHNNALLVQEVGKATSTIVNIQTLIKTVAGIMELHLDYDRGLIMLANPEKNRLLYIAGYGHDEEKAERLQQTKFHLDKPESQGVFTTTFKDQNPILVNDLSEIEKKLSKRSLAFAKEMGTQSLICVPIVYEKESLGILAVDNVESKRPLTKSDINLLMGIASQAAVSITNAVSFQKLQESEKKYRELVENANSIIMRRDVHGTITFFNEFAQRFFGYTEKEILGQNMVGTLLPNTDPARRYLEKLTLSLAMDTRRPDIIENEKMLRKGKDVWVAFTYKPIFDDGLLKEILCIGNDITELKQSEQDKRDLEARLQRSKKMKALGTLAGGVAHDLNNILSGIVSYPELLLMETPLDSPMRKPILTIQKSGEKAAAIVQDLLTLARRGVVTKQVVKPNSIIAEYLESPEYENLIEHHPNVRVKTDLDPDLLNIMGSPVHLSKTVMNLVSNAAEAISDSGEIQISTENRYVDTFIRGYDEVKEGDYVTLFIGDTGIGIPSRDLDRIFEPFYSKKVMGKSGTGLGMAVVWGTVKDHKGYIDVKSTLGKGTQFTLYFPVTRQELHDDKSTASIEDFMGRGESILIVDDMGNQREIASGMLRKLGYSVTSVSSGEKAVAYMKENTADLLILDMIMEPGIDGLETYEKILEIHPGQKAIITSGFSETERVKEAQRLGARGYLKKPYLIEKIGRVIRSALDG
ncbi:ATP-binding protein [Thermodesulfobacteriota bacterium]